MWRAFDQTHQNRRKVQKMIVIDSIMTKFTRPDKFMAPVLNVSCMKCKARWSHNCASGVITCKCGDDVTIEKALDYLVTKIKMYGRT